MADNTKPPAPKLDPTQALLDGKIHYLKGQTINLIGKDGLEYTVDGSEALQAVQQGFKIATEQDMLKKAYQKGVEQHVKENSGILGSVKVAVDRAANSFLFGVPDKYAEASLSPYEKAKQEALRKEHEYASAAGWLAGTAGNLAVTGGTIGSIGNAAKAAVLGGRAINAATKTVLAGEHVVGKIATSLGAEGLSQTASQQIAAGVVRKALANGAQYAVEGALYSAPSAVTEAALGDPKQAAEHLAIGIGLSGLLGASGSLVASGAKAAAGAFTKYSGYGSRAEMAVKSLDPLVKTTKQIDKQGGAKEIGKVLDENEWFRKPFENIDDFSVRLQKEKEQIGQSIGNLYKQVDDKLAGPSLDADDIYKAIDDKVLQPISKDPFKRNIYKAVAEDAEAIKSYATNGKIGFKELHNWRSSLDDEIYKGSNPMNLSPKLEELEKMRGVINDVLQSKGDDVLEGTFSKQIQDLNKKYSALKIATEAAEVNAQRQVKNNFFSMTDNMWGAAGAASALASGNVTPLLGTVLLPLGSKYLKKEAASLFLTYGPEKFGVLFAEKATKHVAKQLDRIPAIVGNLSSQAGNAATKPHQDPAELISDFVDQKYKREKSDKYAVFNTVAEKVNALATNGSAMQKVMEANSTPFVKGGAPTVGEALNEHQAKVIAYLHQSMPKNPKGPDPTKVSHWKPNSKDVDSYLRKVSVVANPLSVVDRLEDGTLHPDHMQALKAVYPSMAKEISNRITVALYDNNKRLNFQTRSKLRFITEQDHDDVFKPQRLAALQGNFTSAEDGKKSNVRGMSNPQTEIARITNK